MVWNKKNAKRRDFGSFCSQNHVFLHNNWSVSGLATGFCQVSHSNHTFTDITTVSHVNKSIDIWVFGVGQRIFIPKIGKYDVRINDKRQDLIFSYYFGLGVFCNFLGKRYSKQYFFSSAIKISSRNPEFKSYFIWEMAHNIRWYGMEWNGTEWDGLSWDGLGWRWGEVRWGEERWYSFKSTKS